MSPCFQRESLLSDILHRKSAGVLYCSLVINKRTGRYGTLHSDTEPVLRAPHGGGDHDELPHTLHPLSPDFTPSWVCVPVWLTIRRVL